MKLSKDTKIYIAGHNGLVGSALVHELEKKGYSNLVLRSSKELDLCEQHDVRDFFYQEKPELVILAAAKVGGINANITHPADFIYDNLMIQNNVIHESYRNNVSKLIFLGSSCIYPKECPQPMKEEYLLDGKLEPTNEGYALAKIAGLKMCEYYHKQYGFDAVGLMPCNIYGPNEKFDLEKSHVLSALVKRFVDAKVEGRSSVTLWGTGVARREFLHVDDLARAVHFAIENYHGHDFINIGSGYDISIKELAETISNKVGYKGQIEWDTNRPDGMLRKCLDVSNMKALGFVPHISLEDGIGEMIKSYNEIRLKND